MKKIYPLIVLSLLVSSCLTTQKEPVHPNSLWQYEIEITDQGTRSEGKIGHLLYNCTEIPFLFDHIFVDGKLYTFHYKTYLWDFGGYQIDDVSILQQIDINRKIEENELNQEWYLTEKFQKKEMTPEHWIWIKRDAVEAFLDPAEIENFIREYKLEEIKPDSVLEIQSDSALKKLK